MKIQPLKERTVLVTRRKEKIIVDIPFDVIDKAMLEQDLIKVGKQHQIRTSAINERFALNATTDVDLLVKAEFPDKHGVIMDRIEKRKKSGYKISYEVICDYANSI